MDDLRFYYSGELSNGNTVICDHNRKHDDQYFLEVVTKDAYAVLDILNDHWQHTGEQS